MGEALPININVAPKGDDFEEFAHFMLSNQLMQGGAGLDIGWGMGFACLR